MRNLLLAGLILISTTIHAETLKLATITSETDKNVTEFYLITNDQNEIDSLRYITFLPNGGIEEDLQFPAETVMRDGIVIEERSGYDVVRLEVENFNVQRGGTVRLNYLYSAMSGTRYIKRIRLEKQGQFQLFDQAGNRINRMFVKGNWSRVFGLIGVRDIETSYKP